MTRLQSSQALKTAECLLRLTPRSVSQVLSLVVEFTNSQQQKWKYWSSQYKKERHITQSYVSIPISVGSSQHLNSQLCFFSWSLLDEELHTRYYLKSILASSQECHIRDMDFTYLAERKAAKLGKVWEFSFRVQK